MSPPPRRRAGWHRPRCQQIGDRTAEPVLIGVRPEMVPVCRPVDRDVGPAKRHRCNCSRTRATDRPCCCWRGPASSLVISSRSSTNRDASRACRTMATSRSSRSGRSMLVEVGSQQGIRPRNHPRQGRPQIVGGVRKELSHLLLGELGDRLGGLQSVEHLVESDRCPTDLRVRSRRPEAPATCAGADSTSQRRHPVQRAERYRDHLDQYRARQDQQRARPAATSIVRSTDSVRSISLSLACNRKVPSARAISATSDRRSGVADVGFDTGCGSSGAPAGPPTATPRRDPRAASPGPGVGRRTVRRSQRMC